jgi:outer membrane lipoprotein carrier protein
LRAAALAVLGLTAAIAAAAPETLPADAEAALTRAVSHYSDGAAHASAFTQIYTPAGFTMSQRESGTVAIQAPQRLRFDYRAPEKKIFTYDAGEGRFFSPEDKQLTIRKLTPEEKAKLPILFLRDPQDLAREYAITNEPAQEGSSRLLLKPRAPGPDLSWLRVSVEADGSVSELSYEDGSGNRTEFRFPAWKRERARPAADFRVAGPPGTRIVEN